MTTMCRMLASLLLLESSGELEAVVFLADCEWPAGAVSAQNAVKSIDEYKSFERFIYISLKLSGSRIHFMMRSPFGPEFSVAPDPPKGCESLANSNHPLLRSDRLGRRSVTPRFS